MSEIPTITIAMVGPRGVGKTSLLAAMYEELELELKQIGCTLGTSAGPTQKHIHDRLRELKKIANGDGNIRVQAADGIDATSEQREYIFNLDLGDGGEPELALRFVDLPGGWYTGEGDFQKADDLLGNAHISLLAVDATALMEGASSNCVGKYHEDINAPGDIRESYKRALQRFENGHLVVLTLIRAETYLQKAPSQKELLFQRTQMAYCELAGSFVAKKSATPVSIYACAVETVGSLIFNRFTEVDGKPVAGFMRKPGKGYSPSKCAVPLRMAIHLGLQKVLGDAASRINNAGTFEKIIDWFGFPGPLKDVRNKIALAYTKLEKLSETMDKSDYQEITP